MIKPHADKLKIS